MNDEFWKMLRALGADAALVRAAMGDADFLARMTRDAIVTERRMTWADAAGVDRKNTLCNLLEMVREWPGILEMVGGAVGFDAAISEARDRVARFEGERGACGAYRHARIVVVPYAANAAETAQYACARMVDEHAMRIAVPGVNKNRIGFSAPIGSNGFARFSRERTVPPRNDSKAFYRMGYAGGMTAYANRLRIEVIDFAANVNRKYWVECGASQRYDPTRVPDGQAFAHAGALFALAEYGRDDLGLSQDDMSPPRDRSIEDYLATGSSVPWHYLRGFSVLAYGSRPDYDLEESVVDGQPVNIPEWVRYKGADDVRFLVPRVYGHSRGVSVDFPELKSPDRTFDMSDATMSTPVRLWDAP